MAAGMRTTPMRPRPMDYAAPFPTSTSYIWGIPRATSYVVIGIPASVEVDKSAKFTSDQTCVRCILRVGFGWPHPASVVRIGLGGS